MDRHQLRESILKEIRLPSIPDRIYSAVELGVRPDSEEIQTEGLQKAIDTISESGGGRLILPAGRYRTGALRLKSKVELHLEHKETVLSFVNEEVEKHYPTVFCHWEASPCFNYSPLIYAFEASDIALTGEGVLDGGADGEHWWNWHHQVENAWSEDRPDLQMNDRMLLRKMNIEGISVEERIFGPGHYLRPNFVQPVHCQRVLFQGFTLKNSPMWQLNPVLCSSLTVDGVTMSSHGANNDGCDPESCDGVHIVNCRFDTGDDCISLKSGRDRDGREANVPCQNVVIERNEFAGGHGGIALGSEMSGGIRRVLAVNNCFSSPDLTYALRLKTNARRGGKVEDIVLADSVMDHVYGAAVHGTMLYEDGRNGSDLPEFRNITIENIRAHGGDYGIFLEAFDEVPITGLVLKNIRIDGVSEPMRGMNWKDSVVENVVINGKCFPRPGQVRILGVTEEGGKIEAETRYCGGSGQHRCTFFWQTSEDGFQWMSGGEGKTCVVKKGWKYIRVMARDLQGNEEVSHSYQVLPPSDILEKDREFFRRRLECRGMMRGVEQVPDSEIITRQQLARMLVPLGALKTNQEETGKDDPQTNALQAALDLGFLAAGENGEDLPQGHITRQEMATVAMQACNVNYRNASSTMPVCADADQVSNNYGTNVARALYFGFMRLDEDKRFYPKRFVTMGEAVEILNRTADFAGL